MARQKKLSKRTSKNSPMANAQRWMNEALRKGSSNPFGQIPYLMRYNNMSRDDAFNAVCLWVDEYNIARGEMSHIADLSEVTQMGPKPAGTQEWLDRPMPELMTPKRKPPKPGAKPRGWHFKRYFEFEGKVYSRGAEVTDKKQIKKLKKEFASSD